MEDRSSQEKLGTGSTDNSLQIDPKADPNKWKRIGQSCVIIISFIVLVSLVSSLNIVLCHHRSLTTPGALLYFYLIFQHILLARWLAESLFCPLHRQVLHLNKLLFFLYAGTDRKCQRSCLVGHLGVLWCQGRCFVRDFRCRLRGKCRRIIFQWVPVFINQHFPYCSFWFITFVIIKLKLDGLWTTATNPVTWSSSSTASASAPPPSSSLSWATSTRSLRSCLSPAFSRDLWTQVGWPI